MAPERISFPEEKIPEVIAVIRAGLRSGTLTVEVSDETRDQLEKQCKELEEYMDRE